MSTQVLQVIAREEKTAPNSKNEAGAPRKMVVLTVSKDTYLEAEHPISGEPIRVKGRSLTRKVTQFAEAGTSQSGQKLGADTYHDSEVGTYIPGTIQTGIPVNKYRGTDGQEYTTITEAFLGDTSLDTFSDRVQKAADRHNIRMVAEDKVIA